MQEQKQEFTENLDDKFSEELIQAKEDQMLFNEIMQSGLLYSRAGRDALGVKLQPQRRESPKIRRNEKCPCNSGLKYKKCCGLN